MKIALTNEIVNFIAAHGHRMYLSGGTNYYHFPFWIKEQDEEYELLTFENLPKELIDIINSSRGLKLESTYYYKDKPYQILFKSRIKSEGLAKILDGYGIVHTDTIASDREWVEVIIYKCLYHNPDGEIWVREIGEFYNLFKLK